MVHYTCDMCGKVLVSGEDIRYKVKIETYIANDLEDVEDNLEDENIVDDMSDFDEDDDNFEDEDELEEIEYKTFHFDLCSACYKKYLQNPLTNKSTPNRRFSEN